MLYTGLLQCFGHAHPTITHLESSPILVQPPVQAPKRLADHGFSTGSLPSTWETRMKLLTLTQPQLPLVFEE